MPFVLFGKCFQPKKLPLLFPGHWALGRTTPAHISPGVAHWAGWLALPRVAMAPDRGSLPLQLRFTWVGRKKKGGDHCFPSKELPFCALPKSTHPPPPQADTAIEDRDDPRSRTRRLRRRCGTCGRPPCGPPPGRRWVGHPGWLVSQVWLGWVLVGTSTFCQLMGFPLNH